MIEEEKIFYVYLDRTLEEVPRVFYVGKGLGSRVKYKKRNKRWREIADIFGYIVRNQTWKHLLSDIERKV